MPRLSIYLVRSSFLCFGFGFTIAAFTLSVKAGTVAPQFWLWRSAHLVLLVNGWFLQLTMGVAYWIFPRILLSDRGRPAAAWAGFILFQAGLLFVIASLLVIWWAPAANLLPPGGVLQALGVALFAVHLWPRVRAAIIRYNGEEPPDLTVSH